MGIGMGIDMSIHMSILYTHVFTHVYNFFISLFLALAGLGRSLPPASDEAALRNLWPHDGVGPEPSAADATFDARFDGRFDVVGRGPSAGVDRRERGVRVRSEFWIFLFGGAGSWRTTAPARTGIAVRARICLHVWTYVWTCVWTCVSTCVSTCV